LAVAFTTWISEDASSGMRVVAGLIGLGAGLAIMLLIAWALEDESPSRPAATPAAVAWPATPAPAPAIAPDPSVSTTAAAPAPSVPSVASAVLGRRLAEGRALGEELSPGESDARVGAWIESVRETLEQHKPGVAGYFNALSARSYADDADRLEAHTGRLATIVRDVL
jgi:hypothetical protein